MIEIIKSRLRRANRQPYVEVPKQMIEIHAQQILKIVKAQMEKNCRTIRALPKDEKLGLYRFEVILTDSQVKDFLYTRQKEQPHE